jgi:ABC-2 type transport system permease protein
MRPDLRKIGVVASTEFGSAVRAKSFLIMLLLLPVIMGGSILLQVVVAKRSDTKPRKVAVIDRTGNLYPAIEKAAGVHNSRSVDPAGKTARPRIELSRIDAGKDVQPSLVLELSDQIRRGDLDAFVVIPEGMINPPAADAGKASALEYHSDNPNDDVARNWLSQTVNNEVRTSRFRSAGIDQAAADRLNQPITLDNLGLVDRAPSNAEGTSEIKAAEKVDPIRSSLVPALLMFIVFFVIMTSAPQLLNSVIEEKMSKISEVLLGSITPFELMAGKLLGNMGIALVTATLYLCGAYSVAAYHGYGDAVSPGLLAALALFLMLAIMLYGSLYMAVGAACNELKDAQSLMMPVMLLSMFPIFVWTAVLQNPSSALSVGMSMFPPATPFLMLMRLALRPAPPAWQVGLSVILTTATALFCIWGAGKVFRVGLLMQGKAPNFRELARWVVAR